MSVFDGMREAKIHERGTFLGPGVFDLEIEKCLVKDTRKSGTCFIVEFRVLSTTDAKNHPVDSRRTWIQKMADKDVAFAALKVFAYGVLGLDPVRDKAKIADEVDPSIESLMDDAVKSNALAGERVRCEVVNRKTQKGLDFSQHNFQPYQAK